MEEINFRKLLDNAPFGYAYHKIIVDENEEAIDYIFLEINSAFTQLTGLGPEIINKRITEVVPNIVNDNFNWIKYYGEIALAGGLKEFEQYSTPLKRWFKVQVYSKEKYYFVTIFIDITKEKTNLEELEEFFSVNLDLLCIADVEGNFIKTNRAWEDILGYKTEELNKRKFLEFIHPDDIPSTLKAMEMLSHQEKVINFVNRYRCQDGSYRYIEWRSHPKGNLIYAAARDITERNEIIEALKHSEEKYKILVENANDIIYSLTLDGYFIYVSPVWKKLLGHEPNELEGKSFSEFVHPDDIPTCFEFLQKIIESKSNQAGIEYRVLHKDGKWRYHKTNGAPVLTPDGKVNYFIGVARDITENKKTEEELKLSIERFNTLAELSRTVNWEIDINGLYTKISSNIEQIWGYSEEEIIGKIHFFDLYPEKDKEKYKQIGFELLQSKSSFSGYENPIIKKDGNILWVISYGLPVIEGNKIIGYHGYDIDITTNKLLELSILENEEKLKTIIDTSPDTFGISDLEGRVRYLSSQGYKMWGLDIQDDIIGKNILDFLHPSYHQKAIYLINEMLNGNMTGPAEYLMVRKDGSTFFAEVNANILRDADNKPIGIVYIDRDITEKKIAEQLLKESEEKNRLLSQVTIEGIIIHNNGIAIDVNSSIVRMTGYSEEEIIGQNIILKSIHPDDINIVINNMQQEHTKPYQVRLVKKDGSVRFIEIEAYNMTWQNKELRVAAVRDITEKKKIADELMANELQFERIIENLPISLSIITIDGTPVYLNSKCIELFEIETEDYQKNISISELWIEPNDRLIWLDELQKNGIIKDFEMKLQTLKGKLFWAIGSGILINYKNQNCVLSTHIDISRRKIAEEELATERNQLLSIFDSIDELIYVSDTDTFEIVFANKKLRNLFGDDVIGKECYNVMQGKDGKCPFCNSERIKAIYPETYKWEYTNHLNKTFIVYNRMIRWTDGRLLRFEIAYDITERKKAEQTLYESEEKLRAIYNSANIGILIVNKEGHFIMVNDWISDLLKYSNDELLNKTIIDVTHLEDIEVSKTYFNKVLKGEIENYKIDKRFLRSDNGTVWCNLSVAPIKDVEHNIIYIVGMVIDITEQKYAEVELKKYAAELIRINEEIVDSKQIIEASLEQKNALIEELNDIKNRLEITNSEKDKFFSIIAHDLRSPFQGFLGLTKLMAEDLDNMSMKDMRELSNNMQNSANNLFKLLDNLLQWSRLQRGAMDFKVDSINIHQIVQQNINISLETAKQKNINLINNVPFEIYAVADYQMINTVIRNLLSNAIKFTNKNGNILIGANSTPEKIVCVFVKDDGIGMDKQILSDLFKIDKKVTRPGTSGEASSGLGLLLCKDFIEKNNGCIWVESEVDKGSTFFFTLPQNVTENVDLSIFNNL